MAGDQTTIDASGLPEVAPDRRAFLVVYHEGRSRVVQLRDGEEVVVGRSRDATVDLEDRRVSRRHTAISRRGAAVYARDLGSRNGTRLNGARLEGEQRLAAGDELQIGGASLVVGFASPAPPTPPRDALAEVLDATVAEAIGAATQLALIMLRLDGSPSVIGAARERLAAGLPPRARVAEYAAGDLALLLPGADRVHAHAVAAAARAAAAAVGATAVAGVALLPDDARAAEELLEVARAAVRAARGRAAADGIVDAPRAGERRPREVVVADPASQRVFELARRAATTPITVLLLGETGVGKEVVAEEIHRRSPRAAHPFIRLSCASLPETLLESELFGCERGAYTGADRRRRGYFEVAAGGTLLLDEIGELPRGTQAKLLRVLEDHRVTRLGGTEPFTVDVRIICATNRDLEAEVREGGFREDLYFRVSAFTLHLPPLRDRPGDIIPLCGLFAGEFAAALGLPPPVITPAAQARLAAYRWPGNVRELRNVVERAVVLGGARLDLGELPDVIARGAEPSLPRAGAATVAPPPRGVAPPPTAAGAGAAAAPAAEGEAPMTDQLADFERRTITDALAACDGNQTRAAARLGITRRALIYRMEKLGLKALPPSAR